MPKVSVIIPCYNTGIYLQETIDSVLKQTYPDFEIVLVNDGSDDPLTLEVLGKLNHPKIKVINTPNRGVVKARNTAVENSSGELILNLDSDDMIAPEYMKEAVEHFNHHPDAALVYCERKSFGEGFEQTPLPPYDLKTMLQQCIVHSCAFFKRKDYDRTKGWNPEMEYYYEDWDFWLSLIELGGTVYYIPKPYYLYRLRLDSRTQTRDWGVEKKLAVVTRNIFRNHLQLYADHFPDPITLNSQLIKAKAGYEEQIKWIYNTADYRLGKAILKPLRFIKNLFK